MKCEHSSFVQVISSGPDARWDAIQEMYFAGLIAAKNRIWITTPYFIPDPSIIMALKNAAISGVDVRIILPYKADSRIVQYASRSYLQEFMQVGVRFYLYRKGFIHAKVIIVDRYHGDGWYGECGYAQLFQQFRAECCDV